MDTDIPIIKPRGGKKPNLYYPIENKLLAGGYSEGITCYRAQDCGLI
jgi:hypothetical protein